VVQPSCAVSARRAIAATSGAGHLADGWGAGEPMGSITRFIGYGGSVKGGLVIVLQLPIGAVRPLAACVLACLPARDGRWQRAIPDGHIGAGQRHVVRAK